MMGNCLPTLIVVEGENVLYTIDDPLQFFQELGGVGTVHLGVMKLEGDGQGGLQPTFTIAAPGEEGIGKDAAVLIDDAVEFRARDSRCADDDGFIIQDVLTRLADGLCQMQVVGIKCLQIIGDGHVAETESALNVIRYYVDGHAVVFVQLPDHTRLSFWQYVKLVYR